MNELQIISDRIETTIRYFNTKAGLGRADDSLPRRTLEEPMLNGPAEGRFITTEGFNKMLDEYYELRGWDYNGHPTKETLSKYGVEEAAKYEV